MTVQADDRRKEYAGNGVTVAFDGPRALATNTIKVYLETLADGATVPTVEDVTDDVTIVGAGRSKTTITFAAAPADGETVVILRTVPYEQQCDITNQDAYLPETLEHGGLDALEFQIQQLADRISRAILGSDSNSSSGWNFDALGRRIINLGTGIALTDAVNLQQLLEQIEIAVNGGPVFGVTPLYWEFTGDGVQTDFSIAGANVDNPVMYDVVLNRDPQEPHDDYGIVLDDVDLVTYENSAIRFVTPPPNGQVGWVVLRGYARPYSLGDPVTGAQLVGYLRVRPVPEPDAVLTLNRTEHGITQQGAADVRCTNAGAVAATLRKNTGDTALDWQTGDFFTITQAGAGAVSIVLPADVTVAVPVGYVAAPRALDCSITLRCIDADANAWAASGDLAIAGASIGETIDGSLVIEPLTAVASTGGVLTLDLEQGSFFRVVLTENITSIVLTNEPPADFAKVVSLEIVQHASVARTVAFPAGWKWAGGTVGAVSTGFNAVDEVNLAIRNVAGTKLYRAAIAKDYK